MAPSPPPFIEKARPFLKWAGGKSQLIGQYSPYFPKRGKIRRYYEPFVGSAAVFVHLQPSGACLADVNEKLVEIYEVVQKDVEALIDALRGYQNDEDEFYRIRAQKPEELGKVERAARMIYLNRTCYNGLYRENRSGEFNVPFGRYNNPTICNPTRLRRASEALAGTTLQNADFEEVVERASSGDLVYFDPPYVPLNATSNFTSYNRHGFSADDQRRLADTFHGLASRGCSVMLSNSSAPLVYDLYDGKGYRLLEMKARRSINSRADSRGIVTELLILSA
jgi:DNA adenine methylase